MKLTTTSSSLLSGFILLLLSLLFNYNYTWYTSNSQGEITYLLRNYGLPLQFIFQELSSPVGPSSYFKISPANFILDLTFWWFVSAAIIYVARLYFGQKKPSDKGNN